MPLAPSVQRKIMWLTPTPLLELLARTNPKLVIKLLCHWLNEKNINVNERFLAPRLIAPVPVAKKCSQLSVLSILNLLRQDESLWQFYAPTPKEGVMINLQALPFILLELMFDLGGTKGRKKVAAIVTKCRTTLGGAKQLQILRAFKTDTVLDIFEMIPDVEVNMILKNQGCEVNIAAFWLGQWDLRMQRTHQPMKSGYWLGQIPGERAYQIEVALRSLEFRRKFDELGNVIYQYDDKGVQFLGEKE